MSRASCRAGASQHPARTHNRLTRLPCACVDVYALYSHVQLPQLQAHLLAPRLLGRQLEGAHVCERQPGDLQRGRNNVRAAERALRCTRSALTRHLQSSCPGVRSTLRVGAAPWRWGKRRSSQSQAKWRSCDGSSRHCRTALLVLAARAQGRGRAFGEVCVAIRQADVYKTCKG